MDHPRFADLDEKIRLLRDRGVTAKEACRQVLGGGVGRILAIRILRGAYDLSLSDAVELSEAVELECDQSSGEDNE